MRNFSIIIPVYNEASILGGLLERLTCGPELEDADMIVVCNGCRDNSAEIARRFEPRVRVIDTPVGSKTRALNLGDAKAKYFPRLYLDADIAVSNEALVAVAESLQQPDAKAAGLVTTFETQHASWAVRSFYRAWQALPYMDAGHSVGSGLYALSAEGRAAFEQFPDIIADDGFIDSLFRPEEKVRPEGHKMTVRAPRRLWDLIRIKSRVYRGNRELRTRVATPSRSRGNGAGDLVAAVMARRASAFDAVIYLGCVISVRLHARLVHPFTRVRWEKDQSSRMVEGGSP